jgi:hypothetical protein
VSTAVPCALNFSVAHCDAMGGINEEFRRPRTACSRRGRAGMQDFFLAKNIHVLYAQPKEKAMLVEVTPQRGGGFRRIC